MRHREQVKAARETFEIFHAKSPREIVKVPARLRRWPARWALVGDCTRTYYESDKWREDGDPVRYYHDHGAGIRFWLAAHHAEGLEAQESPVALPSALAYLGAFLGADFVCAQTGRKRFAEADETDLLCSDPNRTFLVAIDQKVGPYAIVEGPGLTILPEGIDG